MLDITAIRHRCAAVPALRQIIAGKMTLTIAKTLDTIVTEDVPALIARVERLEADVRTMKDELMKQGTPPARGRHHDLFGMQIAEVLGDLRYAPQFVRGLAEWPGESDNDVHDPATGGFIGSWVDTEPGSDTDAA